MVAWESWTDVRAGRKNKVRVGWLKCGGGCGRLLPVQSKVKIQPPYPMCLGCQEKYARSQCT